jgi:phospholipid/cholesterol/gamma-HCH transport system substrate-binding protein
MSRAIKVGIFLVGGVVLFCVGLFLTGSRAQLFGHHFVVYTQFNDINTLQPGAMVRVAGMDAGQISAIEVPKGPSSQFRLKLQVDKKFRAIVRKDSVASIETEGMVGNKFVNIAKGSVKSPECPEGCTLPSQEAVSMGALMRQGQVLARSMHSTIDDLHHRVDGVIDNINGTVGHADGLIVAVKPNVVHMTGNANAIVAGIRGGHGAVGKLLTDKTVASNVERTIVNARQTTANLKQTSQKAKAIVSDAKPKVNQTLANAQNMTHQLNQAVGTFLAPGNSNESTAVALRNTVHGAQQTTTNLADDTEAIKHNFFLRGFFHRRGFFNLTDITPSKYAASAFVKKPRVRVWIPAPGFFSVAPDGSQKLTDTGRSIVDESMSGIVPYLPNNPIVVEGYSTAGMPDQQYVASRQRAIEVQKYLESRFHVDPKRIGVISLGDRPPSRTGKKIWDGVCLVLVVSKKQ